MTKKDEELTECFKHPAWQDAPTAPGTWVLSTLAGGLELMEGITKNEVADGAPWPGRWYGPIPEDSNEEA